MYETTAGKKKLSSKELWQRIEKKIFDLEEDSTGGKSVIDELQISLMIFNDFIANITAKRDNQFIDPVDIALQAGNMKQFAPYFIQFLKNKIKQTDD